jgi:NADPH:quinone reductase
VKLGADIAVNYKTQDFVQAVKDFTQGKGADVILDMVAGDYVAREVECLAEDGRLVIIAVQGGVDAKFNAGMVLRKRLTITGSTLRPRSIAFKTALAAALREKVWPLLARGQCKPQVFKVFKPSQAAEAHTLMESNQHIGKLIIDWALK